MRNKLWILGLGTILLALVTALVLGLLQQGTAATPLVSPTTAGIRPGGSQTARQAYDRLQPWATDWAPDAQVVAVSATMLKTEAQGRGWTFQVYSKARQRLAIVFVETNQIWVIQEQSALYPQTPIQIEQWKLDSDEFLAVWWQREGQMGWKHPSAHSMHLRLSTENGQLLWMVTILSKKVDLIGAWQYTADTGESIGN